MGIQFEGHNGVMPATRPPRRVIEGRFVRLAPLEEEHLPALFAAIGTPEVFAGGYGGGPAGYRGTEASRARDGTSGRSGMTVTRVSFEGARSAVGASSADVAGTPKR